MFVNLKNGLLHLLVKKPKFMAGRYSFVTSTAETVAKRNCYSQKSKLAISLGPLKYFLRFIFSESVAQKCPIEKMLLNVLWNSLSNNPGKFIFLADFVGTFWDFFFSESVTLKCSVEKMHLNILWNSLSNHPDKFIFFNGFFKVFSAISFLRISHPEVFFWKNALEYLMEFPIKQPWQIHFS